jgi:hypothetical protein
VLLGPPAARKAPESIVVPPCRLAAVHQKRHTTTDRTPARVQEWNCEVHIFHFMPYRDLPDDFEAGNREYSDGCPGGSRPSPPPRRNCPPSPPVPHGAGSRASSRRICTDTVGQPEGFRFRRHQTGRHALRSHGCAPAPEPPHPAVVPRCAGLPHATQQRKSGESRSNPSPWRKGKPDMTRHAKTHATRWSAD